MLAAFPLRNVCSKRAGVSGPALYGLLSARGGSLLAPLFLGRIMFGGAHSLPSVAFAAMAILNATYNLASFRARGGAEVLRSSTRVERSSSTPVEG